MVCSAFSTTEAPEIAAGTAERALSLLAAQPEEAQEAVRPQQLHLERFASVAATLAKPRSL